jgi:hypothetical protein
MRIIKIKDRRDLPLRCTVAHQRSIAARTKGKGKRIKKDGFARTGFASQNGQAGRKVNVQFFDKDNVSDRKMR